MKYLVPRLAAASRTMWVPLAVPLVSCLASLGTCAAQVPASPAYSPVPSAAEAGPQGQATEQPIAPETAAEIPTRSALLRESAAGPPLDKSPPPKLVRFARRLLAVVPSSAADASIEATARPTASAWLQDADGSQATPQQVATRLQHYARARTLRSIGAITYGGSSGAASTADAIDPMESAVGADARPASSSPDDGTTRAAGELSPAGNAPDVNSGPRRDARFAVPVDRLPSSLPAWFWPRDLNGDGQLSLAEFAPQAAPRDVAEFSRLDRNGDGLMTAQEASADR